MPKNRAGQLVREARTRLGLTGAELADSVKMGRETLGQFERGIRQGPLAPDLTNRIATRLNVPVFDLLRAMGYQVECPDLTPDEVRLVEAYRRLDVATRRVLEQVARIAGELPGP